jgi:D-alanyl-D-alanine carboxypeptidase/D-alanyl-D-alanine-endopeptidase (penicillin-binding protein 4)
MSSRNSRILSLFILTSSGLALAPPRGEDTPPAAEIVELRRELERSLGSSAYRGGRWSILAVSLDRGDTLLAVNPGEPMVPASNQKLLTTAAALHLLGPDFRYDTFVLSSGALSGAVLQGDLVLYGTGDPTLSDRFFPSATAPMDSLARGVAEAGIREIRGDLVVDGSYFTGPDLHPEWDPADLNDPFAAPVSAVAVNQNLLTIRVEAAPASQRPPSISTLPPGSGIPVVNAAVTTASGTRSRVWLFREAPADPIGIEGEIPLGGRDVWRELPVPEPLIFAGRLLKQALEAQGIAVAGEVKVVRDPQRSILAAGTTSGGFGERSPRIISHLVSPPLLEILRVVNKESNNLLAETVAKTLGRVTLGDGSFEGGTRAVTRFLSREVGLPLEGVTLRDGSGLSSRNLVSAGCLVQLLAFMARSPDWEDFWSTLPEAGIRRELGRMSGSPAARNLRAKTGTMHGVSALSGMVRTRSGERVLFSVMANDVPSERRAKRLEDQVGIGLASITRPVEANSPDLP